jgi:glycosyltransferase involved in cell wall biosynthesis
VPSEWYDNFPNTILESFAFKKCVVATNIGSLKEIVIDKETGLLFELKNIEDLKEKIKLLFDNERLPVSYGGKAYEKLMQDFSADMHYTKLIELFNKIITSY